jgi:hypothetical protein
MKSTTLIYCGEDGEAAKALAATLRNGTSHVFLRSAEAFQLPESPCDRVVFTDDVAPNVRAAISRAHNLPMPAPVAPPVVVSIQGAQFTPDHVQELVATMTEPSGAPVPPARGKQKKQARAGKKK